MLSLDLFDSKYERRLHEGAVDQLEQHRIDVLNDRMQELLARAKESRYKNDPAALASLKQQYEKIKSERDSYYKIREAQQGQDIVDRAAKMKALTPSKPGVAGAVKDVAKGLKNFLQGKPETGPTYEAQKKNSEAPLDQRLQRLKVKARREFPRAHSDEEALILKLLDKEAQDDRLNRQVDARQDAELKRNFSLDREQEDEITDLQTQVGVREGWSDKYGGVMRPPTPYSVYIKGKKWKDFSTDDHARAVMDKLKAKFKADGRDPETITIAPSYMDENLIEGIKDTASATAVIACLLTGGSLSGCATAPEKTTAQQVLKTGQDVGRTVQTAKRITRAGAEEEVRQELRNLARGMSGQSGELNNSNILRIWKRIKGSPTMQPEPEAPENRPAPPRQRMPQSEEIVRETNQSQPAEQAILKRIMVAHRDLLQQYGPEKVMQAVEEVAYNVGDMGEIGSSDVSGWVRQVEQILGAVQEAKDKPSLRDPADNPCWKGYHPVGTKKKNGRTVPNCVPKN